MPKKNPSQRAFLPNRGEGSDDPGVDYFINGVCTILESLWLFVLMIMLPLLALLYYLVWECWQPREKNDGNEVKKCP